MIWLIAKVSGVHKPTSFNLGKMGWFTIHRQVRMQALQGQMELQDLIQDTDIKKIDS